MPNFNFANVNVTIQQFQEISSGKYNAGEVRLTSDHSLGKVNDHVHSRGKNVVPVSHAEVLAVKDVFVRALQQNGVSVDEINRVRRELGLAPDGATDTSLASRSIRPLTRQLVRNILDRNAGTINGHAGAGTIRSHDEMFARYSAEERAGFVRTRRETNLAMMQTRATILDRGLSDAQAVLAGDVRFNSEENRQRLIATAERQKEAILARSHGNPSDAPDATLRFQRNGGGPDITFALGMSEKDYVRKLDDMLVFLHVHDQPIDRNAPIPALTPAEANGNMMAVLTGNLTGRPTFETAAVQAGVRRAFEARYGEGVFKANAHFSTFATTSVVTRAMQSLGDMAGARFTAEQIQAAIVAEAAPIVAKLFLSKALAPMIQAAGGIPGTASGLSSDLFARHPDLKARLSAAQSPEQARSVLNSFLPEIEADIRRQMTVDRCREQTTVWYREKIANAMGIPASALEGRGVLSLKRLAVKSAALGTDIGAGRNAASTDQQIEQCFRGLANASAEVRINLMRQADALDIPSDARDVLKHQILTLDKVTGFNLVTFKQLTDAISVDDLLQALTSGAPVDKVLAEMGAVGKRVETAVLDILANPAAGGDEVGAAANLLVTLTLAKRPDALDKVRAFFARPEVAEINLVHLGGPASRAVAFQMFKPELTAAESNAELAAVIDKPGLASLHAQALNLAFDDLGLGDLATEEKTHLLSEYHDIGHGIMEQVRTSAKPVTPSQLREIARTHLLPAALNHAMDGYLAALARQNGVGNPKDFTGFASDVLFRRHGNLRKEVEDAIRLAVLNGHDPHDAVRAVLEPHDASSIKLLQAFAAVRDKSAVAKENAIREIAARARLDEALVRQKLDANGLRLDLLYLRGAISDDLSKPETDLDKWNPQAVAAEADRRIESFIAKKVAFLAEVDALPLSDAGRGALVVATLSEESFLDADLPAAARQFLPPRPGAPEVPAQPDNPRLSNARKDVKAAFDYAKNILTADKVAQLSDADLFNVFETVAAQLEAAIKAALPEEKRAKMNTGDHAVLRDLLGTALVDYCGPSLLDAAARLAADGRFSALDAAGEASRRRHESDYQAYGTGRNAKGQQIPVDQAMAAEAEKSVAAAVLGVRLVYSVNVALDEAWLPADLAEPFFANKATAEQTALAAALVKRAPGLVAQLGADMPEARRARFKSFAITLDYRDNALAATEAVLRDAAKALREAEDTQEGAAKAEAKLKALAESLFKAQDAAAFVASAAQASGVALNEAQSAKAVALLAEFAAGMPAKNARVLARFIVNLRLTDETAEKDRGRVQILAPQLAGWREFGLDGTGKQQINDFLRDEANDLILDYEKPVKRNKEYADDIARTMRRDLNRGFYTIGRKRFSMRPAPEVLEAFNQVVTTPKARRALSILMSQASALPVLSMQMKLPVAPNDHRPQPLDPSTLPDSGEFVSRGIADPQLFMAQQVVDDVTSIYDLSVSEDGATATLKIVKSANLALGTEESKMNTYFGSVVVEEEVTVDLTAEVPTVTNVRVAQRFDDSDDLEDRYLVETNPIPAPPPVPPPPVPGPAPVPGIPPVAPAGPDGIPPERQ